MNAESKWVDILFNIIRHWLVILVVAVFFAVSSFLYTTFLVTELYYSRGSLYVDSTNKKTSDDVIYQNLITSKELIYTYIEVLKSDHFMALVSEKSNVGYTGKELKQMIRMTSLNETELMEVSVSTPDPEISQKIIQTILDNANTEMARVIQGGSVHIVDNASFNNKPSSPNTSRNVLLGFVLGAIFSIAIIYYLDIFDSRIKCDMDCKKFKLPVLGEIPGAED